MSSRIKGLFSSKKKKDERPPTSGNNSSTTTTTTTATNSSRQHSKEIFTTTSSRTSSSSFVQTQRTQSVASLASSTSAFEVTRDGTSSNGQSSVNLTLTPSSTTPAVDILTKQLQQAATESNISKTSFSSSATNDRGPMTTDSAVESLDISSRDATKPTTASSASLVPLVANSALPSSTEKEKETISASNTSRLLGHPEDIRSLNQSQLSVNAGDLTAQANASMARDPVIFYEQSERDVSQLSLKQDRSYVEQRSHISASQMEQEHNLNEGVYLNSTTEFFPIDDQDEQVYLEQYSEGEDDFPVLQLKVTKLQKQVREMRKFMRGLVQLQVEQYEPATILIQAWWRGCLVRRELKKQQVFSWHKNPKRQVKQMKYLTKADLHQSCERISAPKASLLVTAELGAEKDTIAAIKLQAVFRSQLVRKRVRAYREGMRAATIIQARWRGYRTRTLDTRLGVEQLRFRNLKIQKAFGRVSIKLQYLQGRILALEENSLPLHEAQEIIHKEIEDMADQIDGLKLDLDQGLKQLDEQVSEEKEQTTIELRGLTDRIQKLEEEIKTMRNANSSIEKQVRTLTLELPSDSRGDADKSEQEDEEDDDYEVQYDEDGNRIERPPKKVVKRTSVHHEQPVGSESRRTSNAHLIMDATVNGSPTQMVDSPILMHQQQTQHRGSIGSIHSQGHARTLSLTSQPPPSPSQAFPRAFPASYSPTMSNAAAAPEGGAFPNGVRPHSIQYPGANNSNANSHGAPRPLTMDPNQLFRFHPSANQYIPVSPSSAPAVIDPKKYVSIDDFEYMQAEVDTLRLNNDRLEGMVRELTMRLNSLTSHIGFPG
ncbi:hypothetical protein K457DRAFT_134545 [Linnemannia elongata AG-77]|uniref:IQ domain-containing protein n=1 Tax=Linnemannia elongata AG-77 TaxID=1314771 RepID=A0A197K9R4_9FUNG|nr:hypothetical protein K457DRAFT_134545 [Linnemannia elongata AG-77]